MRKFTSGNELIEGDGGRNGGRGFVERGEHGGREEPMETVIPICKERNAVI